MAKAINEAIKNTLEENKQISRQNEILGKKILSKREENRILEEYIEEAKAIAEILDVRV